MMLRNLVIFVSIAVCVVALALAKVQRREVVALREQERQLRTQATEIIPAAPQISRSEAMVATADQHAPSMELLRLRGEVGQLERRKRELSGVRTENDKLRVQLATKGTNAPGGFALPAGYIKKSDAKLAGYNTPEDTVQSMLWAIQNRDTTRFLEAFNPEKAKQIGDEIKRRETPEDFFKEADAVPGLRIAGKTREADETIVLVIEMLPGDEASSQQLRFKLFDGQWKLVSGL